MRNLLVVGLCFSVVSCYPPRPAGISREAIPLVFELSSRLYGEENPWIELRDARITPHTFRGFYMKVKPEDMKAERHLHVLRPETPSVGPLAIPARDEWLRQPRKASQIPWDWCRCV